VNQPLKVYILLSSSYSQYSFIEQKEWWYMNLCNVDLKYLWSLVKALIYWGRWLKTIIPDIKAPLLNFDKLAIRWCKLLLFLVSYLWISLFVSNRCLLLIVYKTNEYMYWEYNVIIRTLENFPARVSRSNVSYNSDNFLLEYK